MNRRSVLSILAIASITLAPATAVAQGTLTFEGLPEGSVPSGYGGLFWIGMNVHDALETTAQYHNGLVSGANVAVSGIGYGAAQIFDGDATSWKWNSAYFTGAVEGVTVDIVASSGSGYFTRTLTLGTTPTLVNFDWSDLSTVVFNTPGENRFIIDDFTINQDPIDNGGGDVVTTPEPSSLALLGSGIMALVPIVRRRRS